MEIEGIYVLNSRNVMIMEIRLSTICNLLCEVEAPLFDLMKDCDVRELVVPCNEAIQINDTNGCFD